MKLMQVTDPAVVLDLIDEHFQPLAAETVELKLAGGRCLAEAVAAPEDVPAFNRSTVDGYAVAAADTFGAQEGLPALLESRGEVLMGQQAPAINPGQCLLVHTGGMLPAGADAVVMVEDTEEWRCRGNGANFSAGGPGENVIHKGEDLTSGDIAFAPGTFLRAPELGVLASLGITRVKVYRAPVIGLLSTGDELVPCETRELPPGKIRDSNAIALTYMVRQAGAEVINGGILSDSYPVFLEKSRALLARVDCLVLSGGSSVGTRDFTAQTMRELGEPGLLVEGISIQPGKPTLIASCGGKPVLGLPGHPVSALVIFALFGSAILRRLSGRARRRYLPTLKAVLARNIASRAGRTDYVRVKLEADGAGLKAIPVFGRSGMLRTLAAADGLIAVPAEKEGLLQGESVEVLLWE